MKKAKNKLNLTIILAAIIIGIFIFLGFYISKHSISEKVIEPIESPFTGNKFVTKIIDGDTVIIEGESVRLLGIDSDERGYPCYNKAKKRIEDLVLNKEVKLEEDGENKDQYQRYLRYIFLDGKNINLQLVKEGLAVSRFSPQNIKYKQEILAAEKYARENRMGCKWGEQESEPVSEPDTEAETEESITKSTPESSSGIIYACNAGNYINQEKTVEGKIVDTYKYRATSIFLNFEKPYPNSCFTVIIWASDWYKFSENPEVYYDGKTVRVKGKIIEYEGRPEIILKDMGQIEVMR